MELDSEALESILVSMPFVRIGRVGRLRSFVHPLR